jgi:hypothetical protein
MEQFLISYKLKIPSIIIRNPFNGKLTEPYSYFKETKLVKAQNIDEAFDKVKDFHPLIEVVDIENETF